MLWTRITHVPYLADEYVFTSRIVRAVSVGRIIAIALKWGPPIPAPSI